MSCDLGQTRIQLNTAKAAYEAAKQDFEQCQPPDQRATARLEDMKQSIIKYEAEAMQLIFMNEFLLDTLNKETGNNETIANLGVFAEREVGSIQDEIDRLKSEIRLERRRFLDSSPQVSPAVGGLYYTKVPDNQVLIGLLTTLFAFLVVVSIIILFDYAPSQYLRNAYLPDRIKIIATIWGSVIVVSYLCLYIFT